MILIPAVLHLCINKPKIYRSKFKIERLAGLLFKAVYVMKASQVAEINDIASSKL